MPTVEFFEIPADDLERAKAFYQAIFGWEINAIPMGSDTYWMFTTGEKPPTNAGLMPRRMPGQPIINYITVPSVDATSRKIVEAGGQIMVPKTAVPGMGYFIGCLDTENNPFAIWEDDQAAK